MTIAYILEKAAISEYTDKIRECLKKEGKYRFYHSITIPLRFEHYLKSVGLEKEFYTHLRKNIQKALGPNDFELLMDIILWEKPNQKKP
jgi:hypothetical protein